MSNKEDRARAMAENIAASRRKLLNNKTPFAIKEAYFKLRTNLTFCKTSDGSRQCKVFAVTSTQSAEDKSLTAANIAISYAMLGKKVVLVDCDLRRPTQHRLWQIETVGGLCDYITGRGKVALEKVPDLQMWVLCCGKTTPNPTELLSSVRMGRILQEFAMLSDYVIIDTPPVETVADLQIISPYVDGIVIVTKSGITTKDELNAAIDAVESFGGNLCGVVLNDINTNEPNSSYNYSYTDKYGYGYRGQENSRSQTKSETARPQTKQENRRINKNKENMRPDEKSTNIRPQSRQENLKERMQQVEQKTQLRQDNIQTNKTQENLRPRVNQGYSRPQSRQEYMRVHAQQMNARSEANAESMRSNIRQEGTRTRNQQVNSRVQQNAHQASPQQQNRSNIRPQGNHNYSRPQQKVEDTRPIIRQASAQPQTKQQNVRSRVQQVYPTSNTNQENQRLRERR